MYQKKAYFLARKDGQGRLKKAVGTFFMADIEYAMEDHQMEDAVIMDEQSFKKAHPIAYKRLFKTYWDYYIHNYLCSLKWLNPDPEVELWQFDADNYVFHSEWFILHKDPNEHFMILDTHFQSDERLVFQLVRDLKQYLNGICDLVVNPPHYTSKLESGLVVYGEKATQRYLAELMHMGTCLN